MDATILIAPMRPAIEAGWITTALHGSDGLTAMIEGPEKR
jgi:hypothetical protein